MDGWMDGWMQRKSQQPSKQTSPQPQPQPQDHPHNKSSLRILRMARTINTAFSSCKTLRKVLFGVAVACVILRQHQRPPLLLLQQPQANPDRSTIARPPVEPPETTPPTTIRIVQQQQVQEQPVFPHFMEDYIQFHKKHRGQANARYLIWRCAPPMPCGGTGDRIKGILSAFYTALCSRRVLLIDWPHDDLRPFLSPHLVDWTIPASLLPLSRGLPSYQSIDRYDHPFLQQLQIPDRFQDEVVLEMRANLWSEHVHAVVQVNDTKCIQQLWNQEELEQQQQQRATTRTTNDHPHWVQQPKVLFRMGFWCLFTFSQAVHDRKRNMQSRTGLLWLEQQQRQQQQPEKPLPQPSLSASNQNHDYSRGRLSQVSSPLAGQTTLQPYIAVHIRTGMGGQGWKDPVRHGSYEDYQKFYACAKKLQQGIYERQRRPACRHDYDYDYQQPLPPLPIYVAADHIQAKQAMIQLDHQQQQKAGRNTTSTTLSIRVLEQMKIHHIDKSRGGDQEDEKTVWGELNVLLESTCLVASRSGFSDLAAWLQPAHGGKRCAILFHQCDDEAKVQEALNALDFETCSEAAAAD